MDFLEKYTDRIEEMQLAVRALDNWLLDSISQGIAQLQQQDYSYFENIAARLVDLRMSSIARRIRGMERLRHQDNWIVILSKELAELNLFSKRFHQIHKFTPIQQMDLLQQAGLNLKKKDILEFTTPLKDFWLVLGVENGQDDKIRYRRTWLWGEQSQESALILDFAWGNNEFEGNYTIGTAFEADLHFYPSATPIRAVIKAVLPKERSFARLDGLESIEQFILQYTKALTLNPGLLSFPGLLSGVIPFVDNDAFFVCDQDKDILRLNGTHWKLMAISGGAPILLFGTWDGTAFQALSALVNNRIVVL